MKKKLTKDRRSKPNLRLQFVFPTSELSDIDQLVTKFTKLITKAREILRK